jgi:hypothetical protein
MIYEFNPDNHKIIIYNLAIKKNETYLKECQ